MSSGETLRGCGSHNQIEKLKRRNRSPLISLGLDRRRLGHELLLRRLDDWADADAWLITFAGENHNAIARGEDFSGAFDDGAGAVGGDLEFGAANPNHTRARAQEIAGFSRELLN